MENLELRKFSDIDLADPFFDSLKKDYSEFTKWFVKKSDKEALVLYNDERGIEGFLYCKFENGPGDDTNPLLPNCRHMKVGTFKFNPKKTRRGDRYLKKIFDYALAKEPKIQDIYVTVFGEKHHYLCELFKKHGFEKYAVKESINGTEEVLLRDLNKKSYDVDKDYPFIRTTGNKKYLLGIYPNFHTKLFPDSKLHTESPNIVKDTSHSNSIHKIYLSGIENVMDMNRGDIIVIYRTKDNQGPAEYRAVATSICVVEDVHHINAYTNENEFVNSCLKFSVFSEGELRNFYRTKKYPYVINFTYNVALPKRIIRKDLADTVGLNRNDRWGLLPMTDVQFNSLVKISGVNKEILY